MAVGVPTINSAPKTWFGDVTLHDAGDGTTVLAAPPVTRIDLVALTCPPITVDDEGICIAGVVWYRPIDVDPTTMTLICQKVRDARPLPAQARG